MASPCYNCEQRDPPDCHTACRAYAEYKALFEAQRKQRQEALLVIGYLTNAKSKRTKRTK